METNEGDNNSNSELNHVKISPIALNYLNLCVDSYNTNIIRRRVGDKIEPMKFEPPVKEMLMKSRYANDPSTCNTRLLPISYKPIKERSEVCQFMLDYAQKNNVVCNQCEKPVSEILISANTGNCYSVRYKSTFYCQYHYEINLNK
jgi:hypothetical protein